MDRVVADARLHVADGRSRRPSTSRARGRGFRCARRRDTGSRRTSSSEGGRPRDVPPSNRCCLSPPASFRWSITRRSNIMSPDGDQVHVADWSHGSVVSRSPSGHWSTSSMCSLPKRFTPSIASARTDGWTSLARSSPSAPSLTAAMTADASVTARSGATDRRPVRPVGRPAAKATSPLSRRRGGRRGRCVLRLQKLTTGTNGISASSGAGVTAGVSLGAGVAVGAVGRLDARRESWANRSRLGRGHSARLGRGVGGRRGTGGRSRSCRTRQESRRAGKGSVGGQSERYRYPSPVCRLTDKDGTGGPDRIRTGDLQRDRLACWAATPRVRAADAKDTSKLAVPMSDRPIDLRSDTVTHPSPEMRRAMADAELGDNVLATIRRSSRSRNGPPR